VPDPGNDAGMSEQAVELDAPTADPDDIVSGEAADGSDSDSDTGAEPEPADEPPAEEARGAGDEAHEGAAPEHEEADAADSEEAPGEERSKGDDGSSVS
jgi:hypothetical protein